MTIVSIPQRPVVELIRLEENNEHGTFGVLKINKQVFCVTLELSDKENAPSVSSIPAQQYTCKRYSSSTYPDTFQVMDVPGRSYILFHKGNTDDNTEGCILLGQYYGKLAGNRAILNSGNTFDEFMKILDGYDEFSLTIREIY
jgi:hypothetical protein